MDHTLKMHIFRDIDCWKPIHWTGTPSPCEARLGLRAHLTSLSSARHNFTILDRPSSPIFTTSFLVTIVASRYWFLVNVVSRASTLFRWWQICPLTDVLRMPHSQICHNICTSFKWYHAWHLTDLEAIFGVASHSTRPQVSSRIRLGEYLLTLQVSEDYFRDSES